MGKDNVKRKVENFFRKMRGEISQAELEQLNKELDNPQLSLGIGAATEAPRRMAS